MIQKHHVSVRRCPVHLPVSVRVSGFLSQPVDGVKVLVSANVWERLVQEVHQVPGAVHLLCRSGTADA